MVRFLISLLIGIYSLNLISAEEFQLISTNLRSPVIRKQPPNFDSEGYLLKKILKDHHVVVDVGAGNSDWGNKAFSINNSICLYLIEGNPSLFFRIKITNSPNVNPFLVRISNSNQKSEFQELKSFDLNSLGHLPKQISIPTMALTKFCDEESLFHIDLLHIHRASHIYDILLSAYSLLRRGEISAILMSYTIKNSNDGSNFQKILSFLVDQNYQLFLIHPKGVELFAQSKNRPFNYKSLDVIAIHASRVTINGSEVNFRLSEY